MPTDAFQSGKTMSRTEGIFPREGPDALYWHGHMLVLDVRGESSENSPLFLVRRVAQNNSATELFSIDKDGSVDLISVSGEFPDGTAAAPSITFGSDRDTGLYRHGANGLTIVTGGADRGVFDDNGMDVRVGGLNRLQVRSTGIVVQTSAASAAQSGAIRLQNAAGISGRNSADTLDFEIAAISAGNFLSLANDRVRINPTTGDMTWTVDNASDIGASGATRPRTVYAGTSMFIGANAVPRTADVQVITVTGTWTKPTGAKWVQVIAIGAGAGGGGGRGIGAGNARPGGSGGGGGAYVERWFHADALGATESVSIGAGGPGGSGASPAVGGTGGTTSFGAHVSAYGGGGGRFNAGNADAAGGGGGATSAGQSVSGQYALGGGPALPATPIEPNRIGSGGASGGYALRPGGNAERGGAGGGMGGDGVGVSGAGGSSIEGAAGGGGGGSIDAANAYERTPSAGGAHASYANGGGGAAGVNGTSAGTVGTSRSATGKCGDGGGGGGANTGGTAFNGGAGGIPGGGGGGGGGGTGVDADGGDGGAGARGEIIVITYF